MSTEVDCVLAEYLRDHHANPGGYSVFPYIDENNSQHFLEKIETARRQNRKQKNGRYF